MLAWSHWGLVAFVLIQLLYRPHYGYWSSHFVAYLLFSLLLTALNGFFHYRILSKRAVSGHWVLALCVLDLAVLSASVAISTGFGHHFFHILYYPALAFFAAVVASFRLNLVLVTIVAATYLVLSLTVGARLDLETRDEKTLLARIFVMYLVVIVVNLLSELQRTRWRGSLVREQALLQERTQQSQDIHDTAAQSAFIVGLGIDRARTLNGDANPELAATLESTSEAARLLIWGLRRPINTGRMYEGQELNRALRSHVSSFRNITAVPAELTQIGEEPELSIESKSLLFAIAHNALTNALRHADASRLVITLEFGQNEIRLSVSDDGSGLPDDYASRGQGFANMSRDAERLGGRLVVEAKGRLGGATITCLIANPGPT